MEPTGGYNTVESDGFTISSNSETTEAMQASVAPETPVVETPAEPVVAGVDLADPETPDVTVSTERNPDGTFKPKGKPRNDPHARVQQATAQAAEAKRLSAEVAAENARLKAEIETYRAPKPVAPVVSKPADDPEPDFKDATKYPDGQFDLKFVKDQARWEARQEIKAEGEKQRVANEEQRRQHFETERKRAWNEKLVKARAEIPDFDTRLNEQTPLDHQVVPYIMAQDDGPQILLYLSEHQDIAQRLFTLHPIAQIGEIGKIQARLDAASSRGPASATPSKASAPIKPLGGGPAQVDEDEYRDDEPFDAFVKRENAREARMHR